MSFARFLRSALVASATMVMAGAACAQQFPTKPIRIFVGFAAGGGTDTVARVYAAKLQEILKTPVIIENRPGASELLAALPVMSSAPDGHTLWMGTASSLVQGPGVRKDLPYDPLKQLTLISRAAEGDALFVVKNSLPVNTMDELIGYARTHPGQLNYGSAGVGASNHLLTEYIKTLTGVQMVHVPYKSAAEVARELAGGTLDVAVEIATFTAPFVKEGKIRAIATTGAERLKTLPDVPTLEEGNVRELKGLGTYMFWGLVGPSGMQPQTVKLLNDAMNSTARMPDVVQRLDTFYVRPATGTPAELREYVEKELGKWRSFSKDLKLENS